MALHLLEKRRHRKPIRSLLRPLVESLERRELLASYTTPEDTPLVVADGSLAGAHLVAGPAHGRVELTSAGGFRYVPALNYNGTDGFAYSILHGSPETGAVELGTVSLTITPVNDPPEAHADTYQVLQNTPLKVEAPGVLRNDSDVDGDHLTAQLATLPTHGTLTLSDNGSFVYTPAADFSGLDTFTYKASDGILASNAATVGIYVAPIRRVPEARNDSYAALQNTTLNIPAPGVLANDSGVDGRPLAASVEKGPEHGSLTLNTDGSFSYKPATDYTGPDSFVYRATDISPAMDPTNGTTNPLPPASALATAFLYVRSTTPIVVANNDAYFTPQNTALGIAAPGVLRNDYVVFPDPAGANGVPTNTLPTIPLSAAVVSGPSHGTLTLSGDGSFQYVPSQDFVGADTFTYRASLSTTTPPGTTSGSNTSADPNTPPHDIATVTIYVKSPPPEAHDDFYSTLQDTALTIAAPGVLGNDRGAEGHTLAAILVAGPASGQLTLNSSGGFTYTPASGFTGYDSFTYRAIDATTSNGQATTDGRVATVRIYVQPAHPPVYAIDDFYQTPADTTLAVDDPGVLANDTINPPPMPLSPDNDAVTGSSIPSDIRAFPIRLPLTAALLTKPAHGTLTLNANGSFIYTPDTDFSGEDTFTYRASVRDDSTGGSATVAQGNPAALVLTIYNLANQGIVSLPNNMPCTIDGLCPPYPDDIGLVTIRVVAPKPPPGPVAVNDSFITAENMPLDVPAPGVLANDYVRRIDPATGAISGLRPEHPPLSAVLVAGPAHGTLTLNADGSFKYVPSTGFTGIDTFTYQASQASPTADGTTTTDTPPILSNIATVTIRVVTALAHNDVYSTLQGKPLDVTAPGVLANDAGGSAEHPLTAVLLAAPLHGTLTLNANGSFNYVPDAGFSGSDVFTYRATDGTTTGGITTTNDDGHPIPVHDGDVALVRIYVRPISTTIEAHNDKYPTRQNVTLTITAPGVLANDYGPANQPLVASLVDQPGHGTLTLSGDGSFSYTPEADFTGEDHFVYRASIAASTTTSDANGTLPGGSLAVVTIYVLLSERAPTIILGHNQNTTDESGPQHVADWATLVSVGADGKPAIAVTTDNPRLFAAPPTIDATGQLSYTPAPNVSGSATVMVAVPSASPGDGTDTQSFTINVDKPHPLYNAAKPCDVNNDTHVAPNDALVIINLLNASSGASNDAAGEAADSGYYYDVNKDGSIAPIDALMVINYLNAYSSDGAEGESAAATDASLLALVAQDLADATLGRRRTS